MAARVYLDRMEGGLPLMFEWLREAGKVKDSEMLRTFNCGIGMVLVCDAGNADAVESALKEGGEEVISM